MAGDRLYAIAYRIVRDTDRVEDTLQQTLADAWIDLPSVRHPDKFEA